MFHKLMAFFLSLVSLAAKTEEKIPVVHTPYGERRILINFIKDVEPKQKGRFEICWIDYENQGSTGAQCAPLFADKEGGPEILDTGVLGPTFGHTATIVANNAIGAGLSFALMSAAVAVEVASWLAFKVAKHWDLEKKVWPPEIFPGQFDTPQKAFSYWWITFIENTLDKVASPYFDKAYTKHEALSLLHFYDGAQRGFRPWVLSPQQLELSVTSFGALMGWDMTKNAKKCFQKLQSENSSPNQWETVDCSFQRNDERKTQE